MTKYSERTIPLSWWQRMLNIIRPCFGILKIAPEIIVIIDNSNEQKLLMAPKDGGSDE